MLSTLLFILLLLVGTSFGFFIITKTRHNNLSTDRSLDRMAEKAEELLEEPQIPR